MKILIAGGSGLIGRNLADTLESHGHDVVILTRSDDKGTSGKRKYVKWNGNPSDKSWVEKAGDAEAVYNLSGRSISDKWNEEVKKSLETSRIDSTRAVVEGIKKMKEPPKLFVNSSAIGYYGSRGDEILSEDSQAGDDFFSRLCSNWEKEAEEAKDVAGRVIRARTAIVLDASDGALPQIVSPLRKGLGSRLGSGKQWVSWIHAEDAGNAMEFFLESKLEGPVNISSPNPLINRDFMQAIARSIGKKAWMPAPAAVLRATLGEMADYLLLSSQRVVPEKLLSAGFKFKYPDLGEALRSILSG